MPVTHHVCLLNYITHNAAQSSGDAWGSRRARLGGKRTSSRMRHIYVVVCGGKMAALGDTSAPGANGLIQQFTAITGKNNLLSRG